MNEIRYYYLIHIQYLGFRYHGWAKQPQGKTVHKMIDKTVRFVLSHDDFKTLGTSRTDAMVSANHSAFELFLHTPLADEEEFLALFNHNLPSDIRATKIEQVDASFNIINNSKVKTYEYLFSFGEKAYPLGSAIMSLLPYPLDVELMIKGAAIFKGTHNFETYCTKPSEKTVFTREIFQSEIVANTKYTASFFPKESYIFRISSKGFMRNQVRLMMGQLILLGKHEITLAQLQESLDTPGTHKLNFIAPASGLILDKISFE